MRVLHLLNRREWGGGVETYVLNLLSRSRAAGIEPLLAFARDGSADVTVEAWHVPELGSRKLAAESAGRKRMLQLLREIKPDVVHLHNTFNLGAIAACLSTCPTIATAHGYQFVCPAEDFFQHRGRAICERTCGPACFAQTLSHRCMSLRPRHAIASYRRVQWAIRNRSQFAGLIAPCRRAAQRHIAAGFDRSQVHILPYFCPVVPLSAPRDQPVRPTITFIGRLREYKGIAYFIRLLSQLPSTVRGLMVGDLTSESSRMLRRMAVDAGCDQRLELRGWVSRERIHELLGETSVVVFPSIWPETLGIVGLEALAHGVPVSAFDVGGVEEWLQDGVTGALVPVKDTELLVECTSRLLFDHNLAADIGQRGIALMRDKFCPDLHMKNLSELYHHITSSSAGPVHEVENTLAPVAYLKGG